jgi:uncharacterized membrane protein affecting hemolysin expression
LTDGAKARGGQKICIKLDGSPLIPNARLHVGRPGSKTEAIMIINYLYVILVIVAPILLALTLLWVTTHNRLSRRQKAESEAATRRLYKEQDAEDRARDGR